MKKNFGVKSWFYPLPVLIVATYDKNGKPDAMNAAWGGLYESNMVVLCLDGEHKTTKNIKETKAFTVSFGTAEQVVPCDYVGIVSANDEENKIEKSGFTLSESQFVNAPLVNELPLALECKFVKFTDEGNVIGEIVNVCADESILDKNGNIDMSKFRPITYEPSKGEYYELGKKVGTAFTDGKKLI